MKPVYSDAKNPIISAPEGKVIVKGKYMSHYLWVGDENGSYVGTISNKRELRKLRNLIGKILGEP